MRCALFTSIELVPIQATHQQKPKLGHYRDWLTEYGDYWHSPESHQIDGRPPQSMWGKPFPFSTSADAVLPLLEKECVLYRMELAEHYPPVPEHKFAGQWSVTIIKRNSGIINGENVYGTAPTFPLAACLALLRVHGIEVAE